MKLLQYANTLVRRDSESNLLMECKSSVELHTVMCYLFISNKIALPIYISIEKPFFLFF